MRHTRAGGQGALRSRGNLPRHQVDRHHRPQTGVYIYIYIIHANIISSLPPFFSYLFPGIYIFHLSPGRGWGVWGGKKSKKILGKKYDEREKKKGGKGVKRSKKGEKGGEREKKILRGRIKTKSDT